jgi:dihydrofolate reductase
VEWRNSTLHKSDAADAVARLKQQPGKDLVVLGSRALVQSLMRRNLVARYVLLIHPLVLGSGRRLVADGGHEHLGRVSKVGVCREMLPGWDEET